MLKLLKISLILFLLLTSNRVALSQDSFRALLDSMKLRFNAIENYHSIYESYTANGDKSQRLVISYYFQKPKLIRMEVLEGKYPGTIIIFNPAISRESVKIKVGSSALSAAQKIFFGEFFPLHDKMVIDLRGNAISESDWGVFIDDHFRFREFGAGIFIKEEMVEGSQLLYYQIYSDFPEKTYSIKKEEIWIDKKTLFPVRYIHYDRSGKVLRQDAFRDISFDIKMNEKLFHEF